MGRPFVIQTAPKKPADSSQSIAKSSIILDIPTGLAYRQFNWVKHISHDRHQTEDAKETRRGALDGAVGPLALGFEAEESAQFFEGDFDISAQSEADDDLSDRNMRIRAEESGRVETVFWTAYRHPTDSNRVLAWCMPKGQTTDKFDEVFFSIQSDFESM
ncbi:MAG: hypothetical protein JW963_00300 [Anaerolineales bacterium]|nr:hypothetical protein [Anaerolineales bacterium]